MNTYMWLHSSLHVVGAAGCEQASYYLPDYQRCNSNRQITSYSVIRSNEPSVHAHVANKFPIVIVIKHSVTFNNAVNDTMKL